MKEFSNSLLHRKEVKFIVESESNPGFANALKMVSDKYNAKEDLIAVKRVEGKFGRNTFLVDAFIYDSVESKDKIEPKKKVKEVKA